MNVLLGLLVGLLLSAETTQVLLMLILLALQPALGVTVLDTSLIDKLITATTVLDGVLPLQVKFVSLLMEAFEFFGGLVKFNLGGLSFSDLLLELGSLAGNLDGELFDLEGQLLNLGLISSSEFLKSEVILFLLAGGKSPLLQLLLIPIHLKLELIHALVGLEDHVLDVVESVLLVCDSLLQFLDLVTQTTTLSLGDLLQMLFRFNFLVLSIHKTLSVHQLHLNRFEMLFKNLQSLLVFLDLQAKLSNESHLLSDDLVQLLVLIVGIGWEVLIQIILSDRVNYIVGHSFSQILITNLILVTSGLNADINIPYLLSQ